LPGQGAGSSSGLTNNINSKEQRSTTEPEQGVSNVASESAPQNNSHSSASEEALKGPQGPAPKSADDFMKETKRKGSVVKERDNTKEKEKSMFSLLGLIHPLLLLEIC
jgi:hypothetical protein